MGKSNPNLQHIRQNLFTEHARTRYVQGGVNNIFEPYIWQ